MRLLVCATGAATFVVVTALVTPMVEDELPRLAIGLLAVVLPALLVRARVRRRLNLLLIATNLLVTLGLAFGFADDVGRALRRHGDWFIGERNGFVARQLRAVIGAAAHRLETFDPIPELAPEPVVAGRNPPTVPSPTAWVHPLAGPRRVLPTNGSQRFGAKRPHPRPSECELGHCGVDLVGPLGQSVHAVFAGTVDVIGEDERSGRYVIVSHLGGRIRSRYIHIDATVGGLAIGAPVASGQVIASLGRTGIRDSAPHLHFALSRIDAGRERFIDPEPLLAHWSLLAERVSRRDNDLVQTVELARR